MNIYFLLLSIILLGNFFFDAAVEYLNVRNIQTKIPKEFKKIYKKDRYKKSLLYLKTTTYFSITKGATMLLILLLFIALGGFNTLDIAVRSLNQNELISGLIFILTLTIISQALSVPFALYETFVIEEKFGFNKTTLKTFFLDQLKGLLLALIIGGVIIAIILWLFLNFGSKIWILAWALITAIQVFLLFIAPIIIMPLFNKFMPLKKGPLKTQILKYLKEQNFSVKGLFRIDGSRRSTKSNAFFTGFGKFKRIALYDTLIKNHTNKEIVSVLAHEVGHYKKHHTIKLMLLSTAILGITLFIISLLLENPYIHLAFKAQNISVYTSIVFISFFYSPVAKIFSIITNALSRKFEYEADQFAATTSDPKSFINALKKLSVDNLSYLHPHKLKVAVEYSHPPVVQRIRAVKSLKK